MNLKKVNRIKDSSDKEQFAMKLLLKKKATWEPTGDLFEIKNSTIYTNGEKGRNISKDVESAVKQVVEVLNKVSDNASVSEHSDTPIGHLTKDQAEEIISKIKSINGVAGVRYTCLAELEYPEIAQVWVEKDIVGEVVDDINKIPECFAERVYQGYQPRFIRPYGECLLVRIYSSEV